MYRCTECHTEYQECPDYCDCGNDTFEEIYEEEETSSGYSSNEEYSYGEELVPPPAPPVRKKRRMTNEEAIEYYETQKERKKSLIAAGVIFLLCFVVLFVLPPHKKVKSEVVKERVAKENIKIPSVDTYWDNSLPSAFRAKDPVANLPVLNQRFSTISPVLREYLRDIGKEFYKKWNKEIIAISDKKAYKTTVVFTIDKEGILDNKKIIKFSDNESMDDSVRQAISDVRGFEIPPADYKGEKIYIDFRYNERGDTSVMYP